MMIDFESGLIKIEANTVAVGSDRKKAEIGARLRHLRFAYGYGDTPTAWVKKVGISQSAWQNYEAGAREPKVKEVLKICAAIGVSLDWIFRGDAFKANNPGHVNDMLDALDPEDIPPRVEGAGRGRPSKKPPAKPNKKLS